MCGMDTRSVWGDGCGKGVCRGGVRMDTGGRVGG